MPDQFVETSSESWISRLGGSIKSVFFGLLLFFGSIILLWWNEGRAVKTAKGLKEGGASVVSVSSQEIDQSNNGKLVHTSGFLNSEDILRDQQFGISSNSLKLKREVEVFQWVEKSSKKKRKKIGGGEETKTTYTYVKKWQSGLVQSENFKHPEGHQNPAQLEYQPLKWEAQNATMEAYSVNGNVMSNIGGFESLSFNSIDSSFIDTNVTKGIQITNDGVTSAIFKGKGSISNPQLGDIKITYSHVPVGDYSIIGQQYNNSFTSYTTSNGTGIFIVNKGVKSADQMFEEAKQSNKTLTWILRFVGFFVMFAALMAILRPVAVLSDVIPILGRIVNFGLGLASGIVSFAVSLIVISLAWVFYRPIIGISLLTVGVGALTFFIVRARAKKADVTSQ